jgi:hypothetical protein
MNLCVALVCFEFLCIFLCFQDVVQQKMVVRIQQAKDTSCYIVSSRRMMQEKCEKFKAESKNREDFQEFMVNGAKDE